MFFNILWNSVLSRLPMLTWIINCASLLDLRLISSDCIAPAIICRNASIYYFFMLFFLLTLLFFFIIIRQRKSRKSTTQQIVCNETFLTFLYLDIVLRKKDCKEEVNVRIRRWNQARIRQSAHREYRRIANGTLRSCSRSRTHLKSIKRLAFAEL